MLRVASISHETGLKTYVWITEDTIRVSLTIKHTRFHLSTKINLKFGLNIFQTTQMNVIGDLWCAYLLIGLRVSRCITHTKPPMSMTKAVCVKSNVLASPQISRFLKFHSFVNSKGGGYVVRTLTLTSARSLYVSRTYWFIPFLFPPNSSSYTFPLFTHLFPAIPQACGLTLPGSRILPAFKKSISLIRGYLALSGRAPYFRD